MELIGLMTGLKIRPCLGPKGKRWFLLKWICFFDHRELISYSRRQDVHYSFLFLFFPQNPEMHAVYIERNRSEIEIFNFISS